MPVSIPSDLDRLRADCERRLSAYPVFRFAALTIIDSLREEFGEQGMSTADAERLDRELSPLLDAAVAAVTPQQVATAVDDLVTAWKRLRPLAPGI